MLTLDDIADLRAYERDRDDYRRRVIELKRRRRVAVGPIVSLVFENRETMRSQIQEMARAERMVTDEQIQKELDVYNALIPEPGELSATLFIELTGEDALRTGCPAWWGSSTPSSSELPGEDPGLEAAGVLDGLAGGRVRAGRARGRPRGGPHPARDHRLGALHPLRPRPRPGGAVRGGPGDPGRRPPRVPGANPSCPTRSGPSSSPTSGPDRHRSHLRLRVRPGASPRRGRRPARRFRGRPGVGVFFTRSGACAILVVPLFPFWGTIVPGHRVIGGKPHIE